MTVSEDISTFRQTTESKTIRRTIWTMSIVLLMIAGITLITEFSINQQRSGIDTYATAINVAGRQRMLSQRIAYLSEVMVTTESHVMRLNASLELTHAAEEMRLERDELLSSTPLGTVLTHLYYEKPVDLKTRVDSYTQAALTLAASDDLWVTDPEYQLIATNASQLLSDLDAMALTYENLLKEGIGQLREMDRGRTTFVIIALVLVGLLVLLPGARTVTRHIHDLYKRITILQHQISLMGERQVFADVMMQSLPCSLSVYDISSGQTVFMNEHYRQMLGYAESDIMAIDLYNINAILHPDDIERAQSCMVKAAETGMPTLGEYRLRRKDGSYITVESSAAALKQIDPTTTHPQLVSLMRVVENVSRSGLTLPAEVQVEPLIEALSLIFRDAIFLYDIAERQPVYFSARMAELLGYTIEEMMFLGPAFVPLIVHPEDRVTKTLVGQIQLEQIFKDGAVWERTMRLKQKDGEWRTFYTNMTVQTRNAEGKPKLLVGVCFDLMKKPLQHGIS